MKLNVLSTLNWKTYVVFVVVFRRMHYVYLKLVALTTGVSL